MNDCRRGYARRRHERQSGRSWKTYHVRFTGCISNFIPPPHHLLAAAVIIGGFASSNRPSVGWQLEKLMLVIAARAQLQSIMRCWQCFLDNMLLPGNAGLAWQSKSDRENTQSVFVVRLARRL